MINRILILFLITGCAGFYSRQKTQKPPPKLIDVKLITSFHMTYVQDSDVIDEIGIKAFHHLNEKTNLLKQRFHNYLTGGYVKEVSAKEESGYQNCVLTVSLQEDSKPRSMIPSALTLGLLPYIGDYNIKIVSKLKKGENIISESEEVSKYRVGFSLFFIPLAPFMTIKNAEEKAYEDIFKKSMDNINFGRCIDG